MKKLIFLSLIGLSGCTTIHFTNGPQVENSTIREQWHHITLNELVEVSPPMDLDYNCADHEWDSVTIERTFLNGVVGVLAQPVLGLSLYSPLTVTYRCRPPLQQPSN